MKNNPIKTTLALIVLTGLPALHAANSTGAGGANSTAAIDLSKPVAESLKPDVLYWSFDGGTIDDWMPDPVADLSGNGFGGKLLAGKSHPKPTYVQGKFGTGIRLEGNTPRTQNDDGSYRTHQNPRVSWSDLDRPPAPDPGRLDLTKKSFTAGAWIKFEKIETEENQIYIFHNGTPAGWGFFLAQKPNGHWSFNVYGGGAKASVKDDLAHFEDLQWHHVAFSYAADADPKTITFYRDGDPVGHAVPIEAKIAPTEDKRHIFTLGERNVGIFSPGLVGAFDDVFVTTGVHSFIKPSIR